MGMTARCSTASDSVNLKDCPQNYTKFCRGMSLKGHRYIPQTLPTRLSLKKLFKVLYMGGMMLKLLARFRIPLHGKTPKWDGAAHSLLLRVADVWKCTRWKGIASELKVTSWHTLTTNMLSSYIVILMLFTSWAKCSLKLRPREYNIAPFPWFMSGRRLLYAYFHRINAVKFCSHTDSPVNCQTDGITNDIQDCYSW